MDFNKFLEAMPELNETQLQEFTYIYNTILKDASAAQQAFIISQLSLMLKESPDVSVRKAFKMINFTEPYNMSLKSLSKKLYSEDNFVETINDTKVKLSDSCIRNSKCPSPDVRLLLIEKLKSILPKHILARLFLEMDITPEWLDNSNNTLDWQLSKSTNPLDIMLVLLDTLEELSTDYYNDSHFYYAYILITSSICRFLLNDMEFWNVLSSRGGYENMYTTETLVTDRLITIEYDSIVSDINYLGNLSGQDLLSCNGDGTIALNVSKELESYEGSPKISYSALLTWILNLVKDDFTKPNNNKTNLF